MDPRQLVDHHIASGAEVTVAAIRAPRAQANQFGVIEAEGDVIRGFREKPRDAVGLPDDPDSVFASMGNYVFTVAPLMEVLAGDARHRDQPSRHRRRHRPPLRRPPPASVYDFSTNSVPGETERDRGYWRDVGTLDAYFNSHMDLVSVHPIFNLYNMAWPIYSSYVPLPPAKFVFDGDDHRGQALDSMVGPGAIVSGGTVRRSVLAQVHVHSHAVIEDSVLLDGVEVGRGAVVRRAIVDKQVVIPPGARIGVDPERDAARFTVSAEGVVVIGKRQIIEEPE